MGTFIGISLNCGNADISSKFMVKVSTDVHAVSRCCYPYCGQIADKRGHVGERSHTCFGCDGESVCKRGFVQRLPAPV